jgi:hypothetical protein
MAIPSAEPFGNLHFLCEAGIVGCNPKAAVSGFSQVNRVSGLDIQAG